VPKTDQGKLATILYAIIGIPLMLVFLSTIGDIMAHAFKFFYWKVCCTICFRPRVKRISKKQRRRRKERRRLRAVRRQEKAKMAALAALSAIQQQPQPISAHLLPMPVHTPAPSPIAGHRSPPSVSPNRPPLSGNSSHPLFRSPSTPPPTALTVQATSGSGTSGSTNGITYNPSAAAAFRFPRSPSPSLPVDQVYVNRYALQQERPVDFTIQNMPQSARLARQSTIDSTFDSPPIGMPVSPEVQRRLLDDLQRQLDLCSDTDSDSEPDERDYTNVPIPVCLALVVGYICGGAFLFLEVQQSWNFEESAYFCFITLTTIGFGDYLPKTEDIAVRDSKGALILCSLYTILGMAWIAMCFNLVQEEVARIVKSFATMIGLVSKQHDR
jgi:hypothetical protein